MMGISFFLLFLCGSMMVFSDSSLNIQHRSDDTNPLATVVEQQANDIQLLKSQISALQTDVSAIKQKAVAFTARFSQSTVQLATKDILRFDTVPINTGSGYNAHSGIFTAPYSGIYIFLVNIMMTHGPKYIQVAIDKAGTTLAVAHADGINVDWTKGMTHVSVHLNAGDEVWVRQNAGTAGLYGEWWTTFTGVLLHAD